MKLVPAIIPSGKVLIYALISGDRIRYVGQTSNPKKRRATHMAVAPEMGLRMMAIRTVARDSAHRVERQAIVALQRKGQADLNGVYSGQSRTLRRQTISLKESVFLKATRVAKQRGHSFSAYIRSLIESDASATK